MHRATKSLLVVGLAMLVVAATGVNDAKGAKTVSQPETASKSKVSNDLKGADLKGAGSTKTSAAQPSEGEVKKENGAKDLFYKQMSRQSEQLNTGVQYWIELRRNNECSKVNNKFEFKSGDRIKFHVKANISGFAYVVLKEGSKGEHAVLFPDSKMPDDNRIKAGIDYAIPGDGYLMFDSEPGSEKLILVVSRTPIRVEDYVQNTAKPRILVASRQPGAKDLVPGSAVVSFDDNTQIADLNPQPGSPAESKPDTTTLVSSESPSKVESPSATTSPTATPSASNSTAVPPLATSLTTVVEKNPDSVLALDIILTHKP